MDKSSDINCALVLPAYRETESISKLLIQLDNDLPRQWNFIVIDDSPTNQTENIVRETFKLLKREERKLHFIKNFEKSGRGAAVQQGFVYALSLFKFDFLIEMDSDGSHTVESVLKLVNAPKNLEFVVGSRYLAESIIKGWPLSRRILSRIINIVIKKAFHIQLNDWTNGLRRYSARAIELQVQYKFENKGFISLSEQALLLHRNHILPSEIPITFIERIHGSSTVTHTEIFDSLKGIIGLYIARRKKHWL